MLTNYLPLAKTRVTLGALYPPTQWLPGSIIFIFTCTHHVLRWEQALPCLGCLVGTSPFLLTAQVIQSLVVLLETDVIGPLPSLSTVFEFLFEVLCFFSRNGSLFLLKRKFKATYQFMALIVHIENFMQRTLFSHIETELSDLGGETIIPFRFQQFLEEIVVFGRQHPGCLKKMLS